MIILKYNSICWCHYSDNYCWYKLKVPHSNEIWSNSEIHNICTTCQKLSKNPCQIYNNAVRKGDRFGQKISTHCIIHSFASAENDPLYDKSRKYQPKNQKVSKVWSLMQKKEKRGVYKDYALRRPCH